MLFRPRLESRFTSSIKLSSPDFAGKSYLFTFNIIYFQSFLLTFQLHLFQSFLYKQTMAPKRFMILGDSPVRVKKLNNVIRPNFRMIAFTASRGSSIWCYADAARTIVNNLLNAVLTLHSTVTSIQKVFLCQLLPRHLFSDMKLLQVNNFFLRSTVASFDP